MLGVCRRSASSAHPVEVMRASLLVLFFLSDMYTTWTIFRFSLESTKQYPRKTMSSSTTMMYKRVAVLATSALDGTRSGLCMQAAPSPGHLLDRGFFAAQLHGWPARDEYGFPEYSYARWYSDRSARCSARDTADCMQFLCACNSLIIIRFPCLLAADKLHPNKLYKQ
jgi:hypothetical protein